MIAGGAAATRIRPGPRPDRCRLRAARARL